MLDEGPLKRMPSAESLDRRHARAIHVRERHETRVDRRAVDEDRARAALAFTAAFFRAGETEVLAQHVEETFQRMC